MHVGDVLLWMAFATGVLAVVITLARLYLMPDLDERISWLLALTLFAMVALSFSVLVGAFLSSDVSLEYVHSYSATDHEWFYKLAGVWAGGKGSIFLWTFFSSLFTLVQVSVWSRRSEEKRTSPRFQNWLFLIEMVLLTLFIFITLKLDIFAPTPQLNLLAYPDGQGLNPLLRTPLMVIHPPVEFAAYAFAAIPFSASVAYLATDENRWCFDALSYGRISWLLMTLGIIIGALWAYTVLGWGGYWGWDPVETGNLLPWIALTALVHAILMNRRKGSYKHMAPLLGITSFALVLFTTFETRSGYVDSIHAFIGGGVQPPFDPADKLIFLLESSPESTFFISMLLFVLVLGAIFFIWRFLRAPRGRGATRFVGYVYIIVFAGLLAPIAVDVTGLLSVMFDVSRAIGAGSFPLGLGILLFILVGLPFMWAVATLEVREEAEEKPLLSADSWMTITVLILSVWFVATFLLMMQGINGLRPETFETRLPLALVPLGAMLILCLSWKHVSPGFSFYIVALILAATVFSFLVFANKYFFVYIPISLGILAVAGYKVAKVSMRKGARRNLKLAGLLLVFAALLGMVMWGSGPSRIWLGPASFSTDLLMLFGGFLGSVIVFLAGLNTLRSGNLLLSLLGAVIGILTIGFGVGLVLSVIALVLIVQERESLTASWWGLRRPLLASSPHLIHIGAALIIIGYASSTFLPMSYQDQILLSGQVLQTPEGYDFEIIESVGTSTDGDSLFEEMELTLSISDPGGEIARVPLRMVWLSPGLGGLSQQYTADVVVHSEHLLDIYLIVIGFYTVSDGWIFVNTEYTSFEKFSDESVNGVRMSIEFEPMVGLLWSGAWIMSTGIVARVATDSWPARGAEGVPTPTEVAEDEYERRLERELQMLEDTP